jgi:hypothetical protein
MMKAASTSETLVKFYQSTRRYIAEISQKQSKVEIQSSWFWLCVVFWLLPRMGGGWGGAYNILIGKPEGRRPMERSRRRWEDNIKMDLGEIVFGYVDWIHLAQDRDRWRALVNTVMNLRFP